MSLQSEHINELMASLAKAQSEMSHAVKDSTNPHFKSKFADLAAVWQACREPLAKNGLAVTQTMDFAGEKQILVTTLGHSSGQWIKSMVALPIQKQGPQELGSCLSYCRRYALAAMVGVYQDDDDAEVASKQSREPVKVSAVPVQKAVLNAEQEKILNTWIEKFPDAKTWILDKFGIQEIYEVPPNMYEYLIGVFQKRSLKGDKE